MNSSVSLNRHTPWTGVAKIHLAPPCHSKQQIVQAVRPHWVWPWECGTTAALEAGWQWHKQLNKGLIKDRVSPVSPSSFCMCMHERACLHLDAHMCRCTFIPEDICWPSLKPGWHMAKEIENLNHKAMSHKYLCLLYLHTQLSTHKAALRYSPRAF